MGKKIFILFCMFLVVIPIAMADYRSSDYNQECKLAYPMMEVLECETADSINQQLEEKCFGGQCNSTYSCISDCTAEISLKDCGLAETISGYIYVDGIKKRSLYTNERIFECEQKRDNINFGEGQELVVVTEAGLNERVITVQDKNKYLYATNHDWPHNKLQNTQNCIPQNRIYSLIEDQVGTGNLPSVYRQGGTDALDNNLITPRNFVDLSSFDINTELGVGDTMSYFYRWTEVPDINLRYDRTRDPVYCGGSPTNRKLIAYNTIETRGGQCYNVPSNKIRNVECCYDGDCALTGEICGPDFYCTNQKPCNSDFECGTQEGQCSNRQLTIWSCDTSRGSVNLPNGETYAGWCREQTRTVACCDNTCGVGYHCDYDRGCVKDIHWLACPPGACCLSNGDYVPTSCGSGSTCCTVGNSLIGECKENCEPLILKSFNSIGGCDNGLGDVFSLVGAFIPGSSIILDPLETIFSEPCEEEAIEEEYVEENSFGMFDFIWDLFSMF